MAQVFFRSGLVIHDTEISLRTSVFFETAIVVVRITEVSGAVTVSVPLGTITLTGYAPTVIGVAPVTVSVSLGNLTLTGNNPVIAISDHKIVSVPLGTLSLTALAPTVVISEPPVEVTQKSLALLGVG